MPDLFDAVASVARAANVLATLIGAEPITEEQGRDPAAVRAMVAAGSAAIAGEAGQRSFKHDRLDRGKRLEAGIGQLSRRRYNKLFRLTARLDEYSGELVEQHHLFRLGRFAKTGFASEIPWELFSADVPTAAFVAYYTANLGRRALFIAGPQARAFDTFAERIFEHAAASPSARWLAIASVFPRADVLAHLTEAERYQLLARSLAVLRETAAGLREAAAVGGIDVETMIVRRGNDSSTWNLLGGAWNRARDYWLALTVALGAESTFAQFLPGKVLRLMAADVAAWHRSLGKGLDPDTRVWAALPRPWDVLAGAARCGLVEIEAACAAANVDPAKSGWSGPRSRTAVAAWEPTPESVHGVVVDHPELAGFLRRVGVFSGKRLRPMDEVELDRAAAAWERYVIRVPRRG
jgi:hypothetical protein